MKRHRTLAIALVLVLAGVFPAVAQFPPPPGAPGGASPFPPPPGQTAQPGGAFPPAGQGAVRSGAPAGGSPFPMPGAQPAPGKHPCEAFVPIRQDAEKGAAAIRAAGERKATREAVLAEGDEIEVRPVISGGSAGGRT